ncbi:unnamed protein product [Protopolystoma xenopodis]|uniref:Uncharacterized protein n=1 Tax=Protopolystoma xenopodis TaxID=117903 RepID=A0A3S5A4L9_9PLAT|nr:unnamed protein product [Protopolystoma xenopodis]
MRPSSDDVHHMMKESSARFHQKLGSYRRLRQPERRIKAKRLQYNAIQPSTYVRSLVWIMATLTDDADSGAGETPENVPNPLSNAGYYDDF